MGCLCSAKIERTFDSTLISNILNEKWQCANETLKNLRAGLGVVIKTLKYKSTVGSTPADRGQFLVERMQCCRQMVLCITKIDQAGVSLSESKKGSWLSRVKHIGSLALV